MINVNIKDNSMEFSKSVLEKTCICKPDGTIQEGCAEIITEHTMQIFVNEKLIMRLVCTPNLFKELVLGRLITGGYIRSVKEIEQLYICESGHTARVYLTKQAELSAHIFTEPTCCTSNQVFLQNTEVSFLPFAKVQWEQAWVFSLIKVFHQDSKLHKSTWGTHSCYLAVKGKVLCSAEDISRHNAMDKVIGRAALEGVDFAHAMLFTTGRIAVDMVQKAIAARIPILVSKAVPTFEAVGLAKKYELTLICKAWPDQFEIFA